MGHFSTEFRVIMAGMKYLMHLIVCAVLASPALAENFKEIPRRLPPEQKVEVPAEAMAQIERELKRLQERLAKVPAGHALRPDIEIMQKAVRYALLHGEFYKKGDEKVALKVLDAAHQRLDEVAKGRSPWTEQRGLVVRGYRSDIDGSAQPYGLVIPENLDISKPVPLYVWLHGRGDTNTDLYFINDRMSKAGQIQPPNAIVLHPFGRQCVGFKSAGEIDVLDAIASVKERYNIDEDRIVLMGFSMGGAGAWHIGAHYADQFAAVHAGAGFVDVQRYQKVDPASVPWYEAKLWGVYDVPNYVRNLFNIPVIAYSGEEDKQKAAADIMEASFAEHGEKLPHIIGPKMGHKYHPDSLKEVMAFMAEAVKKGRTKFPESITLQTRTLHYPSMYHLAVERLEHHWEDARVDVETREQEGREQVVVRTKNVSAFYLPLPLGTALIIDGESPGSYGFEGGFFQKDGGRWMKAPALVNRGPHRVQKDRFLHGPIDDAFMTPFMFVLPTGKSKHPAVQKWVDYESQHQIDRWRALMRGEVRVKKDVDVTPDDIQKYNLILWGDSASNSLIKQMAPKLPLQWWHDRVAIAGKEFDSATHVPVMIYPNAGVGRYVVLNSGLTFREDHDRTNSLQNPKLPDWAIINVTVPPDGSSPGKVVDADFFDENWRVKKR